MKFKFLGRNDSYCLELLAYGIEKKGEYLSHGQIIEVPDKNTTLIESMDANGLFERVNTPTVNKAKKEEKK